MSLLCLNGQHETCAAHPREGRMVHGTCGCPDELHNEDPHNHSWERTDDGVLCCACGAWIDESAKPGAVRDDPHAELEPDPDAGGPLTVSTFLTSPAVMGRFRAAYPRLDDEMLAAGAVPLETFPDGAALVARRDENRRKARTIADRLLRPSDAADGVVTYETSDGPGPAIPPVSRPTAATGPIGDTPLEKLKAYAKANATQLAVQRPEVGDVLGLPVTVDASLPPGILEFRQGDRVVLTARVGQDLRDTSVDRDALVTELAERNAARNGETPDASPVDARQVKLTNLTAGEVKRITAAHLRLDVKAALATVRDIVTERLANPGGAA